MPILRQARHRPLREDRAEGGGHHHHGEDGIEHHLIQQSRLKTDECRGEGGGHLGHGERPHHQDLRPAITEQSPADPGGQSLAANRSHQHQARELIVGQALPKASHIQQQAEVDEKDRDEQNTPDEDHLLLDPPLRENRIHRQSSKEGADDLLHPRQLRPKGRQEQGDQHGQNHPVFIVDPADHKPLSQPADPQHHHQGKQADLHQQPGEAGPTEIPLAQTKANRQ